MSALVSNQLQRLRFVLLAIFIVVLIPAVALAYLGYRQLQFESFYQYQSLAAELTARIDRRAAELFAAEDAKSFVDFGFLIVGDGNLVQRSPLSSFPVASDLTGLVSYFQVDADGAFSTPLLPREELKQDATASLQPRDYEQRRALENQVFELLAQSGQRADDFANPQRGSKRMGSTSGDTSEVAPAAAREPVARSADTTAESSANMPVGSLAGTPASTSAVLTVADVDERQNELAVGQRVFDELNTPQARKSARSLGKVAELKLAETYSRDMLESEAPSAATADDKLQARIRRLEKNVEAPVDRIGDRFTDIGEEWLTTFESEVEPFRFDVIDQDHFVLFRNVWQEQQRFVQGAVIERAALLDGLIGNLYSETGLAALSNLTVAHEGEVLHTFVSGSQADAAYTTPASEITGTLLYRTRLTAPVNAIELIFSFTRLPIGPGGTLIGWTAFTFLALLLGGFTFLYRMGQRQIALAEQQQDFVSAVSHELKTPLTSIRMYGEILKAGWASEEKKRTYYDFIFQESERLTRLINNVLQLARINRNNADSATGTSSGLELRVTSAGELVDLAGSKISSHVTQAGFTLTQAHENTDVELAVDADAFVQIVINLIDNAVKFSATAAEKRIHFSSRLHNDSVEFLIRDHGPGVPKNQMKKIFKLFYRTQRELTRETVGTGIGLALVHELVSAMGGDVEVRNANPGAEFRVRLPVAESAKN